MQINGVMVRERGLTFAVVVVKRHVPKAKRRPSQ